MSVCSGLEQRVERDHGDRQCGRCRCGGAAVCHADAHPEDNGLHDRRAAVIQRENGDQHRPEEVHNDNDAVRVGHGAIIGSMIIALYMPVFAVFDLIK